MRGLAITIAAMTALAASAFDAGPLLAIVGADAWSPLDLPGLSLWLDASDAATLTLSNDFVVAWADKSGSANHTTQPSVLNRRLYVAADATANGLPSVASTNDYFRWVTTPDGVILRQAYFVIAYKDGSAAKFSDYATVAMGNSTSAERFGMGLPNSANWFASNVLTDRAAKNGDATATTVALPLPLTCLRFDFPAPNTNSWRIGASWSPSGPNRGWNGPICEVVFVDHVLADADRAQLESYLMGKWSIE